jgi:hypothetical protein
MSAEGGRVVDVWWSYLVFKIIERLATNRRQLGGGETLMTLLLAGARFRDGLLVERPARPERVPMAA